MLGTRFTELFGLVHPVMSAPMGGHSGGGLAGAVSRAGGLGSFGGMGPGNGPGWITEQVTELRSITDRPFAVGFITPFLDFLPELLDEALAQRPDAVCLSFSEPGDWAERVHESGAKLICQVQDLAGADEAVEAGSHVLVAQGTQAGGHTGSTSLLPLIASVVDRHPEIPVLAAGGIGDGATMAAAMVAGADGVVMGTAFLATTDAREVADAYKELIVESDGTDTTLTDVYDIVGGYPFPPNISDRMRVNRFTTEWDGREDELRARREEFQAHVGVDAPFDPELHAARYGPAARFVDRVRPAAAVIDAIVGQAESVLRSRPATLLSE